MASSRYKPSYKRPKIPKGLGISTAKAIGTIGSRVDRNRELGFGARQYSEKIQSALHGVARESYLGTQRVSLGMGRTGGTISKRMKQQAHSGRAWSHPGGRGLAVKTARHKLRSKPAKLPRLRVN